MTKRSRAGLWVTALASVALGAYLWGPAPPREPPPQTHAVLSPLGPPTSLANVPTGEEITLSGIVRTSFDGTVFDAATRTDRVNGSDVSRSGGVYEIERAGLRVVAEDPKTHVTRVIVTGAEAPACRAAGIAGACLLPRTADIAHERLLTSEELARTLTGAIDAQIPYGPAFVPAPPSHAMSFAFFGIGGLGAIAALFAAARARRESTLGRIRAAASEARRATSKDATLSHVNAKIDELITRAEDLDASRTACKARLAKIDRRGLEAKRTALLASTAKDAGDTLAWVSKEIAEAERLDADIAAANLGLERIVSALGVIALQSREERGVKARVKVDDPVDTIGAELERREEALAEAEDLAERGGR